MLYVALNSHTAGKYRKESLNGREHLVTEMVPIVGNTVMNEGLYPEDEVAASYQQLNNIPAPNGHPRIGNKSVSAFHPVAINAHNTGGFIRSPRRDGCRVICEFWLDVEVANGSDDGKELISRIENGKKVGVSTGLTLDQSFENGEGADGKPYKWVGSNFEFDHVAILLNERAAGEHAGTELVINGEKVSCAEIKNELSAWEIREKIDEFLAKEGFYVYVVDFFPESRAVIYEETPREGGESKTYRRSYDISDDEEVLLGSAIEEVDRKVTYETVNQEESSQMANKDDNAGGGDAPISIENARTRLEGDGYTILNASETEAYNAFVAKKEDFDAYEIAQNKALDELRKDVVENSALTDEDVAAMGEAQLTRLKESFKANGGGGPNRVDNAARGGVVPNTENSQGAEVIDYMNPPLAKEA